MNTTKLLKNLKAYSIFFILMVSVISCTDDDEEDGPCETETTCFNGTCIESPVPGTCFD